MISVWGRGHPCRKRPSVALSVAPSVAPFVSSPGFSLPSELEISKQPDETPGPKSLAATSVPKYSEDDLQKILKAVLEAWAPAQALAVSETS